ncbi:M10 family metallopeptidase C-terminal domain-containing protein [Cereibacter sp. SYSU M97828]|nr:M10 family metallopeptidase C-terminal domain-containing protein [Cereibacter flavus]
MPTYFLSANRDSVQEDPFVMQLRNGNLLGLWTDLDPDPGVGGTFGVYGRTLAGDLTGAVPSDTRIPDLTEDIQSSPVATSFANGSFAVAFRSKGPSAIDGTDDPYYDGYIKFFDANGKERGPAVQFTPNAKDDHYPDDMATLANGQALTLVARYESAGDYDLLAYRHDSTGRQVGGPVRLVDDAEVYVNAITGAGYISPSLAASRDGNYAVSWHQQTEDGDLRGYAVWTRVFRIDGTPVGPARVTGPLLPHPDTTTGADQRGSEIAARNIGGYALAWMGEGGEIGAETDVHFRLLRADGSGQTRTINVSGSLGPGDQVLQDVVDLGEGRSLVTWFHQIPDAIDDIYDGGILYGRVIGTRGSAITDVFRISDADPLEYMGGGNTIINAHGQIVSTYQAEISYANDDDVLVSVRNLSLPRVNGTAGNDRLIGTSVNDQLHGGGGHDVLIGGRGNDRLFGGAGNDELHGGASRDRLEGGDGRDVLHGGPGRDLLFGGAGADKLYGGTEDDTLNGGLGPDLMAGGGGADTFVFGSAADSTVGSRDRIVDFQPGTDRLDLRGLGDLRFSDDGAGRNAVWLTGSTLYADVNGNGRADFAVVLDGVRSLDADDFLL